jgi:retinol dehydrogenase 12
VVTQPTDPILPMAGQVCVLTGASSGIGKAASVALAGLGATMVLVARDTRRGEAALAEVGTAAAGAEPRLELADLASQEQVRSLADRLGQLPRIDVLINNAGLVVGQREYTNDGIERTFAVNHLAPFLLTNLLAGKLAASQQARVVTVSSSAHRFANLDPERAALPRTYVPMLAYGNSKLANILFTRELARRVADTGITANCLHPGVVSTRFGQSGEPWLRLGVQIIAPVIRSPESGASTVIYLAGSAAVAGQTGGYYVSCKRRVPSRAARNDDLAKRLWDVSAKLTGLVG